VKDEIGLGYPRESSCQKRGKEAGRGGGRLRKKSETERRVGDQEGVES